MLEHVVGYNGVLIGGMFAWILSIVFLPFPTELLSSAAKGGQGVHGLYIGTMLIASLAVLAQAWAVAASPELQAEEHRGEQTIDEAVILVVLMAVALVVAVAAPTIGLWALLFLVLQRPVLALVRRRQGRGASAGPAASGT